MVQWDAGFSLVGPPDRENSDVVRVGTESEILNARKKTVVGMGLFKRFGLVVCASGLLWPGVMGAQGAVWRVPADVATIQGAMDIAQSGDEVVISPGTYREFELDFQGKGITVRGTEPDVAAVVRRTVIDGQGLGTVVRFHTEEDASSVLAGVTITGGLGQAPGGGGISCTDASAPTIEGVFVTGNRSLGSGGGIYCKGASPSLRGCVVTSNDANVGGGGIACELLSRPDLFLVTVRGNRAREHGGGITISTSSPQLTQCTIIANRSGIDGTGVGGGISLARSSSIFRNCVIADNDAVRIGGGIYVESYSRPRMTNCTVVENGVDGSGAGGMYADSTSSVEFINGVLWGNEPTQSAGDVKVVYSDVEGGAYGVGNVDAEPALQDRRGFRGLPTPGSVCVDAGEPVIFDAFFDRTPGWPAAFPNGERSDMGAYGGPCNRAWLGAPCVSPPTQVGDFSLVDHNATSPRAAN